jgi:hypothetical protein
MQTNRTLNKRLTSIDLSSSAAFASQELFKKMSVLIYVSTRFVQGREENRRIYI